ncbi:restin homolog [Anguilla anguilla]|uniref:restin homolog n=1 Tax=Anguilla anguilla TaxID=7936 RepID=UPI0015ADE791|nr:restin homolog [Anguilla anguilla]
MNEILDLQKKKEDLEDHFKSMQNTITSIMMDNRLLKESCKAYEERTLASDKLNRGLKIIMENKVKDLETEAEILKNSLKMTAKRLQQREGFLQQKLVQEKMLRQESEEKLNSEFKASEQKIKKMNTEHEEKESSYKNQFELLKKCWTDMTTLLHSTKFEHEKLKESSKAFQAMTVNSAKEIFRVKTIVEEERSAHHEEMNALKTQLNMVTIQAQETETTLQNTLAQEKALLQETEAKLKETDLDWEEKQGSDKAQIKELLEHLASAKQIASSAKSENEGLKESCKAFQQMVKDSTEEMLGLKENTMQEHSIHQNEIETLQKKLESMIIKMDEKETALLQKLAEEEARTAQANGKFVAYKEDLIKVTKERQHFLKNEIRHFQGRAQDNLMAYRDAENQLARERRKTADLQRRLDALNEKLAQCSQTSYWALGEFWAPLNSTSCYDTGFHCVVVSHVLGYPQSSNKLGLISSSTTSQQEAN